MHANNEIGTVNDIAAIARVVRAPGCLLHVDAAQSAGKLPIDVRALDVDLLSDVGAQVLRPEGHRGAVRATHPARRCGRRCTAAGTSAATAPAPCPRTRSSAWGWRRRSPARNSRTESRRLTRAARRNCGRPVAQTDGVTLNGHREERLPGALNISVADVEGEALLLSLSEFALSTGSACTSASLEPSYVLRALGLPDALAHSSLRISLGRFTARRTWRALSSDCARWCRPAP
jgi:cysteine desulfurase